MFKHGESPQEFFDYRDHPFADTYRLKNPYLGEHDNRFLKTALSLIANGKALPCPVLREQENQPWFIMYYPGLMSIVTGLPWFITGDYSEMGY